MKYAVNRPKHEVPGFTLRVDSGTFACTGNSRGGWQKGERRSYER